MSLDITLYVDVDTGGSEPHRVDLYHANYTHNCNKMADEAGLYEYVWRTDECDDIRTAGDLIPHLRRGIAEMRSDPARFQKHNPTNGWGSYASFVPWLERYLKACEEHPKARIHACR
jgi:hypothetical protein